MGRKVGQPLIASGLQANSSREVIVEPIETTDGLLSTVYNVEVCATGIEYPLASGPMTFTPEDLVEVVASQNDPAIQSPRVWLGHPDDDRFHAGRATPAGSAEPALGKVVNLRVEDQGQTLVGDIAGCPTWLANILASAYPSRSIEGFKDAQTVTGHEWKLVITDLALLGVTWPGVSTLDDLASLYSETGPEGVEVKEEDMSVAAARALSAQVNIDDVRRAFYAAVPNLDLPAYSWIRAMQIDPNELIIDDDEGNLYAVAFDISGEEVSFSDPVKKKIQYVNAEQARDPAARSLLTAAFTNGRTVLASWEDPGESRPATNDQEVTMTPEQLRASIGLPADATAEQVQSRIQELQAASERESGSSTPEVTPPGTQPAEVPNEERRDIPSPDQLPDGGDGESQETEDRVPVAASAALPKGYVAVPASQWASVQANAQAGAAVAAQAETTRREGIIANAIQQGRISPAQKDNFVRLFQTDPTGAETLLTAAVEQGGLMPGTIPVEARGVDPSAADLINEAYPAHWLPELGESKASNVTMEV